ncbi:MAG: hypothetical protein IJU91_04450 [Selenomonadaceae bacterium]|nr:hypothetical protein [Selenomonadaceae bacterium]
MDLMAIGKVGSYLKQKNLMFAANYKIKTGQRITDGNGNLSFAKSTMFDQIRETCKKSAEEVKAARLRTIKQKLMNGKKLSDEELGFLRVNDKDLYKKAQHAEDAREELKAELKGAKTKQEARQILTRAMVKASAEASAEIAACQGASANISGGFSAGGSMSAGAENISIGGDAAVTSANISAGENISTGDISTGAEMSAGDTSTAAENVSPAAENISADNKSATSENASTAENKSSNAAEKNSRADSSSNAESDTPESILEKFIMTIRALEDEWRNFTNSDAYKDLPEDYEGEKVYRVSAVPNPKFLNAIFAYRQNQDTKNIFNSTEVEFWKNITLQS